MHKKVQSLLITGVLSANMFGPTVAVFADDESKKEDDAKVEEVVKPEEEKITWQTTDGKNYQKLWNYKDKEDNTIVLEEYIGAKGNNIGDREKNVEIPREIDGKKVVLENLNNDMFKNVERIRVAEGKDLIKLNKTNLEEAFYKNESLKSVDLRGIDVSKVTNLDGFLQGASKLKEVNLSGWDVSNVTDLFAFLSDDTKLEEVNLSGWNLLEATNMQGLFHKASALKTLDIKGWKTSNKLTNTNYMFDGCSSLKSLDLSALNMDNVINAQYMFQDCSSLTEIKGTENWTLKSMENMQSMFKGTGLNFIDLSKCELPTSLDLEKMGLVFGASENVKKLLIVTDDKKLEKYNFEKDGREPYNIIFDTDGGRLKNESDPKTIQNFTITTARAKLLSDPIKDGYKFERWKIQKDNTTLKAIWKEAKPETPEGKPETPEAKPETPEAKPETPEGKPETPEGKPETPEAKPETPEGKPETPEGKPETPEAKPETPEGKPEIPEAKPETPGEGTNNDNTPVLDGTDKDNIMIHPLECLPSVYTLVDENMVSITQRGDGTENNPVILQVKDSIYKVDLNHFITKFDTLNSNVSTITRNDKYTEYNMTVDNKNLKDPTKSKTTNVKLRVNNTKLDLLKEANRYSRRRNYDVKIPIIVKFNDVKDNFWGRSCIEDFASMGIVDGYPNNEFKPNNSITRAEFVRIINNAFGYTKPAKTVKFNDVEKNSWYYNDIAIGLEKGYINGRSETVFSPNDNITREEVAMILTNIMKNKDNDFNRLNNFNDGNKTSDWAKSAVAGAIKAGYLIGDDQKNLSPTKNMTRAEAISSLSRVRPIK